MVKDKNIKLCLLGSPIIDSLSPKLHGYWIKKYKLNGKYSLCKTKPEDLEENLNHIMQEGFAGCNITIPLKEKAFELMDSLDDASRACRAVNTVVFKDGKKFGYNSDGFGFLKSLNSQQPNWSGENIVIIGAGGAARGIISKLKNIKTVKNFSIINRSLSNAEELVEDLKLDNCNIYKLGNSDKALANANLLINCTSLGMLGCKKLNIDLTNLPIKATVCDIIYKPIVTDFLKQAKSRGNFIVEGLPMLLHQGRIGFKYWFGIEPLVDNELYNKIKAGIKL